MNNRTARLLIGALLSFSAPAQEGDLAQKEKARKEQEMRERNAQPQTKTGQTAGNQQQTSDTDKKAPKKPKAGKSKSETDPPKP
jgi:hypothetical protein